MSETKIGKHLLGRIPSPPDERDFKLENFLHVSAPTIVDPVALAKQAAAEAKLTTNLYKTWAAKTYPDVTATHWWKMFNALSQITGSAGPTGPSGPPGVNVIWNDPDAVLDQGNYGTCVGNGCAQFGNSDPVEDHYTEKDARAIYYEATVLDGAPDDPDKPGGGQQGATTRSGVKALKNRGRVGTYAVTTSVDSVRQWLQTKGSVVFGTNWYNDMFNPNPSGYITPTGSDDGGHCYLAIADLLDEGSVLFLNSWGSGWGLKGKFKMKYADVATLLGNQGEAWVAVELNVA